MFSTYVSTGVVKIPAPKSKDLKWIDTNPKYLITRVQNVDKNHNNLILPVIKILKYWNTLNGRPFTSFQIEKAIVDKINTRTTIKQYFLSAISAIDEIASGDTQKKAIRNLREKLKRLNFLEANNFHEYIEQELNSFLPFP